MDDREEKRRRYRAFLVGEAKKVIAQLDEREKASLRGLRPRLLKQRIPAEHETRFIELGLAEQKLGGLVLTPIGKAAAQMLPRF